MAGLGSRVAGQLTVHRVTIAQNGAHELPPVEMRQRGRHIVALGGGGFSNDPFDPRGRLLDDVAFRLAERERPRICFIHTASGDADAYAVKFYRAFGERAITSDLSLYYHPRRETLREFILGQDIVYVGGGNTLNMLALWRQHGLDRVLTEAWTHGVVLAGVSAGMIGWFEQAATDSFVDGRLTMIDGLGLLPGSACSHYSNEPFRRPEFQRLIAAGGEPGIAVDDNVALHYVGTELVEILTVEPGPRAYRVSPGANGVLEEPIEPRLLVPAGASGPT
jgi:dipeptidase E